jgi:hypothetical protein
MPRHISTKFERSGPAWRCRQVPLMPPELHRAFVARKREARGIRWEAGIEPVCGSLSVLRRIVYLPRVNARRVRHAIPATGQHVSQPLTTVVFSVHGRCQNAWCGNLFRCRHLVIEIESHWHRRSDCVWRHRAGPNIRVRVFCQSQLDTQIQNELPWCPQRWRANRCAWPALTNRFWTNDTVGVVCLITHFVRA